MACGSCGKKAKIGIKSASTLRAPNPSPVVRTAALPRANNPMNRFAWPVRRRRGR